MLEEHTLFQKYFPASLNIIKLFFYFLKDSELSWWTVISKCALKQMHLQGYWRSYDHTPRTTCSKNHACVCKAHDILMVKQTLFYKIHAMSSNKKIVWKPV